MATPISKKGDVAKSPLVDVGPNLASNIPQEGDSRDVIVQKAAKRNKMSDPILLEALLKAENGSEGQEFGFGIPPGEPGKPNKPVPEKWRGFNNQAGAAAHQITLTEERYTKATGQSATKKNGEYTNEFIHYFSRGGKGYDGYAPLGSDNDPHDLNANHLDNIRDNYRKLQSLGDTPREDLSLLQPPEDMSAESFMITTREQEALEGELQIGAVDQLGMTGGMSDMFEAIFQKDRLGRAEFARMMARSGLARQGLTPEDVPDEMTGDQFMEQVLDIPSEVIERTPFQYDSNRPVVPQILEWATKLQQLEGQAERMAVKTLLGESTGPVGMLLNLGGATFAGLKRLRAGVGTVAKRVKNARRTKEQVAAEKAEKAAQQAQLKADQEKLHNITEAEQDLVEFFKDPGATLPERVQIELDNNITSIEEIKKLYNMPNVPLSDAKALAILTRSTNYIEDTLRPMLKQLNENPQDTELWDRFLAAYYELVEVKAPEIGGISAAARRTRLQQELVTATKNTMLRNWKNVVTKGTTTRADVIHQLSELPSEAEIMLIAHKMARPGAWKGYNELLVAGFLSGTATWLAVNPVSNISNMAWWLTKTQVAGVIPGNKIGGLEAWKSAKAMAGAFRAEHALFWKNLQHPTIRFGTKTKVETLELDDFKVVTADNLPTWLDPAKPALNRMAHWNRFFIRMAVAQDEFFKGLAVPGALAQAAHRAVRQVPGYNQLSLAERRKRYNDLLTKMHTSPHKFPQEMGRARHMAGDVTLTNALGPTGEAIIDFTNSHPGLKMFMLFVRTPTNGFKMSFREMPIIGQIRDLYKGQFTSKDPFVRAEAQAKMAAASLLAWTVWDAAEDGIIMGSGSPHQKTDEAMRANGFRPGTVGRDSDGDGIADQFWTLARSTPMGQVINMIATAQQASGFWTDGKKEEWASAMGMAIYDLFNDQPFLETSSSFMEFLNRLRGSDAGGKVIERWVKEQSPSYLMPVMSSLRKNITRAIDPVKRQVPGALNELQTWMNVMLAQTPGLSSTLPPEFNSYGNPNFYTGGWGPDDFDDHAWARTLEIAVPGLAGVKVSSNPEDLRERALNQFMQDNGAFWPKPKTVWQGIELDWTQQQALNLVAGKGEIPTGWEKWGLQPTGQLLRNTMTFTLTKELLHKDNDLAQLPDGTFRLSKVDTMLATYNDRYQDAFDKLLKTPLFENVKVGSDLLQRVQPRVQHAAPQLLRPKGFSLF